jgi:hypothetical protein
MTQSKRTSADENAMTAGDLQEICIGSNAESKASCRFYLLGIKQGISIGIGIADGKTQGGRPCIPENLSAAAIELTVKMKMGQDLMVFPDDHKLDASGLVGAILVSTFPCLVTVTNSRQGPFSPANTAKTDLPGKGPCTNVPQRYKKLEQRLAWFYGCMHEEPPTTTAIKAAIAAMPPEKQKAFLVQDLITQEALLGVATYALPIQVFPDN